MNSFIQRKKAKHMNERSFLPGLFLFESASVNDALFCRMEGMLLETRREREREEKEESGHTGCIELLLNAT